MPSDSFYITLGIVGLSILVTGFAMSANASQPGMSTVTSFMILGGIASLLTLGGGGAFDLYKRFRGWQLEEREENLSYKEREREVKRQEEDLKRQRRQAKEEERRRTENEKARRRAEEERRAEESARAERTRYKERKTSRNKPPREEVSGFGSEKKEHTEGSWFGTGDNVPEDLKKKKAEAETYSQADQNELEKESQSEKDYKYQISLDKHLLLLWTLYRTNEHEFDSRNKLIIETKGDINNRTPWYRAIEDLERKDLIKRINENQRTGKDKEWGERITDLGLSLIKKARYDQVTKWDDFQKQYNEFLRT